MCRNRWASWPASRPLKIMMLFLSGILTLSELKKEPCGMQGSRWLWKLQPGDWFVRVSAVVRSLLMKVWQCVLAQA